MDTRTIAKLAEIMGQHSLCELEVEEQGIHVHMRRGTVGAESVPVEPKAKEPVCEPVPMVQPVAAASEPLSDTKETVTVTSPLVGTYYASNSPEAEPFVHEGSVVKPGMTLCIIEAMKVMNEVKAEQGGVITKILLDNKTTVEYGSALFEMKVE